MKMRARELVMFFVFLFVVMGASLFIGWYVGFYRIVSPTRSQIESGPVVDDYMLAYEIVESSYDGEWNKSYAVGSSIDSLVRSLGDRYSYYVDGPAYARVVSERELNIIEGLGVVTAFEEEFLRVVDVLPGSPAEAVGVMSGELIYEINGESVLELGDYEASRAALRLPIGANVILGVRGEDGARDVKLQVGSFSSVMATYRVIDDSVGVMKAYRFREQLDSEWEELWNEISTSGVEGLILDLRNNPGGNGELELLNEFINSGTFYIEQVRGEDEIVHVASDEGRFGGLPVVVLVNRYTGSAAEVVAAAFQDLRRGVVVGEPTLGKDSVSGWFELWSDAGMQITIGHWLRGDRTSVGGVGVIPDVRVDDRVEIGSDPALDEAIRVLESGWESA